MGARLDCAGGRQTAPARPADAARVKRGANMNQHRRWMPGAIVIGSVLIVLVGLAGYAGLSPIDIRDAEIQQSGEGFQVGEFMVAATFGYSDDGDRLRYAIIRTWPVATPPSERVADTRVSWGPGILPLVRHADGVMRPVETD